MPLGLSAASPRNGFASSLPSPCRGALAAHVLLAGGPADGYRGPAVPLEALQLPAGGCVHLLLHQPPAWPLQDQGGRILCSEYLECFVFHMDAAAGDEQQLQTLHFHLSRHHLCKIQCFAVS